MKTNAIVRIVIFSILILVILGILIAGIVVGKSLQMIEWNWNSSMADGNVGSKGFVDASEISELDIEWVSGSITIQAVETDTISFSENSGLDSDNQMVWKQSGDKLILQFQKPRVFFGFSFGLNAEFSKDLVIYVPANWNARQVNIESVSADMEITGLTADNLELNNVSGNCELNRCSILDVEIETVSGEVDYSGSLSTIDLNSVSADCSLNLTAGTNSITMECVSGDLSLTIPQEQGFTVELDGLNGRIHSEFLTTSVNGKYRYGDESCRIEGECVSGSIHIYKAEN